MLTTLDVKLNSMGKLLIWLGESISDLWCKLQCKWNWMMSKLMFNVDSCPNKLCTCKK